MQVILTAALILLLVLLTLLWIFLTVMILTLPFDLYAMFHGAFFAPSRPEYVETMVRLLRSQLRPQQPRAKSKKTRLPKISDLGSGDGRILIALAKAGFQAHAFEISPI